VIQVSPFWQQAIAGGVILVSVALNARGHRQAGRQILEHAAPAAAAAAPSTTTHNTTTTTTTTQGATA